MRTNENTTAATFEAAYIAARKASRSATATLTERYAAQDESAKIARRAARAGVRLDEIGLDEQARRELVG